MILFPWYFDRKHSATINELVGGGYRENWWRRSVGTVCDEWSSFFFFLNIRNARNSAECYARTIRTTHCKINQLIILSENIRRVYIARKLYSFRRTKDERQQVDVCNTRPRDAHPSTHPPDAKSSSPRARVPVNACVRVCSRTGWMGVGVGVCVCMKCPGH